MKHTAHKTFIALLLLAGLFAAIAPPQRAWARSGPRLDVTAGQQKIFEK